MKKADGKGYILYDSTYITFEVAKTIEMVNISLVSRLFVGRVVEGWIDEAWGKF